MFRSELLRWPSRVELSRTRASRNTQFFDLHFRAQLTEGKAKVHFHRESPAGLSEPYL
jgi:hypothetical protein